MRRVAATAVLLLVASFAILAAGCGGDDASSTATPADEWADSFCSAVTAWTDDLQRIGDSIDDPSSLTIDALEESAADVSTATDEFVEDVRALGAPDTESGDQIRESVESLADTLEQERQDLEDAAQDVSDLTDLPQAIVAIGTSLTAMGTAFQSTMEALDDADVGSELETALDAVRRLRRDHGLTGS